ncbi:hypothetical protein HK099_003990 [Clydaea vesicula]|uniref:Uncharacterized protein n=1 Tax=Clydaea vesicula TaxID=447962 RepID=A0AAD5U2X0_9FUNG|nr:hypothetical protein HK099_003990 [Clydaea vesicula]
MEETINLNAITVKLIIVVFLALATSYLLTQKKFYNGRNKEKEFEKKSTVSKKHSNKKDIKSILLKTQFEIPETVESSLNSPLSKSKLKKLKKSKIPAESNEQDLLVLGKLANETSTKLKKLVLNLHKPVAATTTSFNKDTQEAPITVTTTNDSLNDIESKTPFKEFTPIKMIEKRYGVSDKKNFFNLDHTPNNSIFTIKSEQAKAMPDAKINVGKCKNEDQSTSASATEKLVVNRPSKNYQIDENRAMRSYKNKMNIEKKSLNDSILLLMESLKAETQKFENCKRENLKLKAEVEELSTELKCLKKELGTEKKKSSNIIKSEIDYYKQLSEKLALQQRKLDKIAAHKNADNASVSAIQKSNDHAAPLKIVEKYFHENIQPDEAYENGLKAGSSFTPPNREENLELKIKNIIKYNDVNYEIDTPNERAVYLPNAAEI